MGKIPDAAEVIGYWHGLREGRHKSVVGFVNTLAHVALISINYKAVLSR